MIRVRRWRSVETEDAEEVDGSRISPERMWVCSHSPAEDDSDSLRDGRWGRFQRAKEVLPAYGRRCASLGAAHRSDGVDIGAQGLKEDWMGLSWPWSCGLVWFDLDVADQGGGTRPGLVWPGGDGVADGGVGARYEGLCVKEGMCRWWSS